MMEKLIKEYIEAQKGLLDSGEVSELKLKNVTLNLIEEHFGDGELNLNGWQGDYWYYSDEYYISGCMYDGSCTVKFKKDGE